MPAFNPDQYLAEKTGASPPPPTAFDPNKYLAEKTGAAPVSDYRAKGASSYDNVPDDQLNWAQKLERGAQKIGLVKPGYEMFSPGANEQRGLALKTAANTATLGYEPQIKGLLSTGSVSSPEYIAERDKEIADLAKAKSGTRAIGEAVGTASGLLIPSPGIATSTAGRIGEMAATGAVLSGAANPGDAQGQLNPVQAGERTENALKGAAIGGAAGTLAEAAPTIGKKLGIFANKKAIKQSGAMLRDLRALDNTGQLEYAGQTLLDHGIITPGATVEDIADRTSKKMDEIGGRIGKVQEALDEKFPQLAASPIKDSLPNPTRMANQIEEQIMPQLDSIALKKYKPEIASYIEDLKSLGDQPIPFAAAKKELSGFDNLLNWDKEQGVGQQLAKQVRGVINKNIEDGVEAVGRATDFPLYDQWKKDKTDYGVMAKINQISNDKVFRHEANRLISPSDYGMGLGTAIVAGASGHGTVEATLAALGSGAMNHTARRYGNSFLATGANEASKAFSNPGTPGLIRKSVVPGLIANRAK